MRLACLAILLASPLLAQGPAPLPRPDHVLIVVEENRSYSEIAGNSAAPYINALAQQGALFTSSWAITHPSQPNYIALFSGSTQGVTYDSTPPSFSAPNLGASLLNASLSFVGYSEGLPEAGSQVSNAGAYYRKHNPWVDFTNVPDSSNLPFNSFPTDLGRLPTVAFVIPDCDNDMHDGTIEQADAWLKVRLDAYVQWAQTHNSLLIVTWDEDDGTENNRIPTLFVGPMVLPGQYPERIDHYTLLRTIEDMYGLAALGQSASAAPISDVWRQTGTNADSDGDGFPDHLEIALGTDPFDPASTPFGGAPAGAPVPLSVRGLAIRLNFARAAGDSIQLRTVVPIPDGFQLLSQPFVVDVGGVVQSFSLGQRGSARASTNTLHMAVKAKRGVASRQNALVTIALSRGDFATALRGCGLTNDTLVRQVRSVPVIVLFNRTLFQADVEQRYSAVQGKSGRTQ